MHDPTLLWNARFANGKHAVKATYCRPGVGAPSLQEEKCHGLLLPPHPAYRALDTAAALRATAWQVLLREALADDQVIVIRAYLNQQSALSLESVRTPRSTLPRAGVHPARRPVAIPVIA